jgi:hypothetical protein
MTKAIFAPGGETERLAMQSAESLRLPAGASPLQLFCSNAVHGNRRHFHFFRHHGLRFYQAAIVAQQRSLQVALRFGIAVHDPKHPLFLDPSI